MKKHILMMALMTAVAVPPAPVLANDLVQGIVGGMIGAAIVNGSKQKPKRSASPQRSYSANSAQRTANRETQTALNYFGFNAGGADGVLGAKSRAAISAYQAHLGYPATGQLTQFERDFLVGSYHRAQSGGPATAALIAQNPQGVRGLLITYRDEQMNGTGGGGAIAGHYGLPAVVAASVNEIAKSSDPSAEQLVSRAGFVQLSDMNGDGQTDYILDTSVTGSAFWCSAQSCAVRVFVSTPTGYERNDFQAFNVTPAMFECQRGLCNKVNDGAPVMAAAPVPAAPQPVPQAPGAQMAAAPVPSAMPAVKAPAQMAAASPQVPQFFGNAAPAPSLASQCNMINLMTSTNGYTTVANMQDPSRVLAEQLCFTRGYAIARGDQLMEGMAGVPVAQVDQQCAGFGDLLKTHVSAAALQPRAQVLQQVGGFALGLGMAPQQLEQTALVCLASGYRTDDMNTAVGSALLLVALGKAPYAELLGHHLSQGFGMPERADLALDWYGVATEALASGTEPVFAPAQADRPALLQAAVSALPGGGGAALAAPVPAAQVDGVPVFNFSD